jgi:hypothetical protein
MKGEQREMPRDNWPLMPYARLGAGFIALALLWFVIAVICDWINK